MAIQAVAVPVHLHFHLQVQHLHSRQEEQASPAAIQSPRFGFYAAKSRVGMSWKLVMFFFGSHVKFARLCCFLQCFE